MSDESKITRLAAQVAKANERIDALERRLEAEGMIPLPVQEDYSHNSGCEPHAFSFDKNNIDDNRWSYGDDDVWEFINYEIDLCPYCKSFKVRRHGYRIKEYLHIDNNTVLIRARRYKCNNFSHNKTFMQTIPCVDTDHRITAMLREKIVYMLRKDRKYGCLRRVSKELNVDEKVVAEIGRQYL